MDDCKEIKMIFFPFATIRIKALADFLNDMGGQGYKLIKIKFDCILYFEKANIKPGRKYYVLTESRYRGIKDRRWSDIKFLENRIPDFHYGDGEQLSIFKMRTVFYRIYLTKFISDENNKALEEHRTENIKWLRRVRIAENVIIWLAILYLVLYRFILHR